MRGLGKGNPSPARLAPALLRTGVHAHDPGRELPDSLHQVGLGGHYAAHVLVGGGGFVEGASEECDPPLLEILSPGGTVELFEGPRPPPWEAGALARMVLDHREGLGLSQREFARKSGISRTILSKVEQGGLYPGGKVRRKLAAAMALTPMDLWWIGPDVEHRPGTSRNGFRGQTRNTEHREAS
jgi:DNA-binding XRE family transcriptional regulator